MKWPRLKQPLFSKEHSELYSFAAQDRMLFRIVTAYDSIWNLLYFPDDVDHSDTVRNAEATLANLGMIIEVTVGQDVFGIDPRQMRFEGL